MGRWVHFTYLVSLTIYIELEGHMIPQNDTLDEADGPSYREIFWVKNSHFGQKDSGACSRSPGTFPVYTMGEKGVKKGPKVGPNILSIARPIGFIEWVILRDYTPL